MHEDGTPDGSTEIVVALSCGIKNATRSCLGVVSKVTLAH